MMQQQAFYGRFEHQSSGAIRDTNIAGVLMLGTMITFPRSFAEVKIALIGLFLATNLVLSLTRGRQLELRQALPAGVFYLIVAALGIIWTGVGAINGGDPDAFADSLRLYVGWSAAYFLLIVVLRQFDATAILHNAIVLAGIAIAVVNALGIYDFYFKLGLFPPWLLDDLSMLVGFHDGYVQVTSHNIGYLMFVGGYLIAWHCRSEGKQTGLGKLPTVSLIMTIAITIFSGRRATWLALLATPAYILVLSVLSHSMVRTRNLGRLLAIGAVLAAVAFLIAPLDATLDFVQSAFSPEDERSIQSGYLIDGFLNYPVMGSGFGMSAGYLRSDVSPWLYELTYHQILFNFGVVGTSVIAGTAWYYFRQALRVADPARSTVKGAFELLCGSVTFLIGTYSNPYLGSFDFLLVIAVLPLLSTYAGNEPSKEDG